MSGELRSYDVQGLALSVGASAASLLENADAILTTFATARSSANGFFLRIEHGPAPCESRPPADLTPAGRSTLPDGIELVCYVGKDIVRVDLLGLAGTEIRFSQRRAKIIIAEGAEWCLGRGCLVPVLCRMLATVDQHVIHSATLELSQDGRERVILLAGSREMGKTTTSLALARSGMSLMGDDVCFARRIDGRLRVWGLLLACKVHDNSLKLLPWLSDLPRHPAHSEGEHIIDVRRAVGTVESRALAPAAIVILDRRNDIEHRLAPLDKVSATSKLARENIRAAGPHLHDPARKAFNVLGELVRQTPTFGLSVGPNLETLGETFRTALKD